MSSTLSSSTDQDALLQAAIDRSLRYPVMFFLTSGAAWLAVALCLGVIASAKVHNPEFLGNWACLTYGRVYPAHINALVYGWGMQAAFAVILWLMARHSGRQCPDAVMILTAGHVWNLGVALGFAGILSGDGTGMPWMEFPPYVWPVLLGSYCVIVMGSFNQFRVHPQGRVAIPQWYIFAAMLWFPWIYTTSNLLLHCLPGHPVMAAGINAWYKSALVFLFFTPVGLGAAYDLAGQVTGRPVSGDALVKLGFWSLAVIAPWAGMQKLAGAPVPYFLPYVGAAAAALLFIPICAAVLNTARMMRPWRKTLVANPTLQFITAGIASLMVIAVTSVVLYLPESTLPLTQFSLSGYGFDILALYGFFSLVMFGATYVIVPRMAGRAWISNKLVKVHFLFSVYGMITICWAALIGGFQQGMGQENWQLPWIGVVSVTNPYAVTITFAWCLMLFSNVFFFLHLILMWRLPARPGARHALGEPAPAMPGHTAEDIY